MRAECVRTIWHGAHHLALSKIFGQQNRVGGRVCHGRRVELVEAVDAAVDGLLFDERSHGIVDEDFRAIGNACLLEQVKRGAGAVHTLGATRNHGTHLGITGFVDEHVHHIADTLVDHDDDVAHAIVAFERSMLQQTIGLSPTETNCLGLFSSNRVPKPAANTTATTGIFCSCICSLSLIRPTVNPRIGLQRVLPYVLHAIRNSAPLSHYSRTISASMRPSCALPAMVARRCENQSGFSSVHSYGGFS